MKKEALEEPPVVFEKLLVDLINPLNYPNCNPEYWMWMVNTIEARKGLFDLRELFSEYPLP